MNGENGTPDPPAPPSAPQPVCQVVVTMNETLGVWLKHNCPSGDVAEMLLYRALMYVQRELTAGRLFKVEEPKILGATSIPKRLT